MQLPPRPRDKEDLILDGTANVERAELSLEGFDELVVVGFRANGAFTVYVGETESYQFNTACELRRAYDPDAMYKAEAGRLVKLTRLKTERQVRLVRHDLEDEEQAEFLARMARRLESLRKGMAESRHRITRQIPVEADIIGRAVNWLAAMPAPKVALDSQLR